LWRLGFCPASLVRFISDISRSRQDFRHERESVCGDKSFNLHEKFFSAQIALEEDQAAREEEGILKGSAHDFQIFRVSDVHFED
jgi:hypothetical protein